MESITGIEIFFGFVILYAVFAAWLGRLSITMPIVFVAIGAITGPSMLGWISFPIEAADVESITEITLALLLFADASMLSFRSVNQDRSLIGRLLFIGLPLTILLGGLVAYILFPGEGIWFAFLIASILAPTDAALGSAIFNNPKVPTRIRRVLTVESGFNDGIATPIVALFIALAVPTENTTLGYPILNTALHIGIATLVGITLGLAGGMLFSRAVKEHWTNTSAELIGNAALALGIYFLADSLGGNGFIAAFSGGIAYAYATRRKRHAATEFTEAIGTLLSLFVWTVFGGSLAWMLFTRFNPLALLYGILSLTVIRMLPVALTSINTGFRMDTKLILGWLGPRGLASVVFLVIAFDAYRTSDQSHETLLAAAGWTILLSVILHGLTAQPIADWYARRLESASPEAPELVEMEELPIHTSRNLT